MATRVSVRCVYRCCSETNGFCRWGGSRCHYTENSSRNKILEQHLPFGCFNFRGRGLVNIGTSSPTSQSLQYTPSLLFFIEETMWQSMKYIFPADDWRIERRTCYILYDWGWTWTSKPVRIVGEEHAGRCFVNRELIRRPELPGVKIQGHSVAKTRHQCNTIFQQDGERTVL